MNKKRLFYLLALNILLFVSSCSMKSGIVNQVLEEPDFKEVSVHDPSVIYADDQYYIIGSHLNFASSKNLIQWNKLSENVESNTLFDNVEVELAESFNYAETDTLWASDIVQLADGRYYLYYCACEGSSPLSTLGVAISDTIEGPYKDQGVFLKSGTTNLQGEQFNPSDEPNVIDPHVFYDNEGKLWMVYGSYSGGIFILEMDENTALPKENQGYGKKLLGGNHSRIEAPYILYNKETKYYYLFLSFGGLDADGGYNIRVARSKTPDGPYLDSENQNMISAKGTEGSFFDDTAIEGFGAKLIGNYQFNNSKKTEKDGYISPGHNSAYYNTEENKYFIIFHARFPNYDEYHEVRAHQMFFNEAGWPVITPLRYSGETIDHYTDDQIEGEYKIINHGKDITSKIKKPSVIHLKENGSITGDFKGSWSMDENMNAVVIIDNYKYHGVFISQWDEYNKKQTMTFSGMSEEGISIFGIKN